jgi:hypothetical protein
VDCPYLCLYPTHCVQHVVFQHTVYNNLNLPGVLLSLCTSVHVWVSVQACVVELLGRGHLCSVGKFYGADWACQGHCDGQTRPKLPMCMQQTL